MLKDRYPTATDAPMKRAEVAADSERDDPDFQFQIPGRCAL